MHPNNARRLRVVNDVISSDQCSDIHADAMLMLSLMQCRTRTALEFLGLDRRMIDITTKRPPSTPLTPSVAKLNSGLM